MTPASSRRGLSASQWLLIALICAAATALVQRYIRIGFNETHSLQARVFLIIRHVLPRDRGDYVVFRWQGQGGFYRPGVLFTKIIRGVPGDVVEVAPDGLVKVSGAAIGYARTRARNGAPLEAIAPGVIPTGHFFVAGQTEDSFDSRYQLVGLIKKEHVVGRAYAVY